MPYFPTPPLPDLARAFGKNVRELSEWFIEFYNSNPVPWNYRSSTRAVRAAYKGFHNLVALNAGCSAEKNEVGRTSNCEVVQLAAPLAFGRVTHVIDLPRRRFSFGRERQTAYRIPFVFVEHGIIKAYFLQPRKGAGLTLDEFAMVGKWYSRSWMTFAMLHPSSGAIE